VKTRLDNTAGGKVVVMSNRIASRLASVDTHGRVEGVVERRDDGSYRFDSAIGTVIWRRVIDPSNPAKWATAIDSVIGVDLLAIDDPARFVGIDTEHAAVRDRPLASVEHGRPYAYDSLSQLFDDPKVPRHLSVPAPGFPMHGNTGNHGALTSVQCRGMFVAAGPGVKRQGWVAEHGRLIDVAPTLMALLGAPTVDGTGATGATRSDARLRAQDGDELAAILDSTGGTAKRVVAVVFDGCNTNLLADAIAMGEVPAMASLLARGTGLRHGIVSSFPTVTLPNHTTAFTGVHPGRHGVIGNDFLSHDGTHVNLLEFATMVRACNWLSPDVDTVHEAVRRWQPDAFTAATYEYADRGAVWSTFGEFRGKRRPFYATQAMAEATATTFAYEADDQYRFMSRIDESSLGAAIEQWAGRGVTGHDLPTLQLVNLGLTDETGHKSGPHEPLARAGLIDSDRRLARLLDAIEAAGATGETAIVVISDHGMEQCDPALLDTHPHADLTPLHIELGLREVSDVFLHPA
jgi:phosphonoacetate hydrolase